jgi:hypothetical protein
MSTNPDKPNTSPDAAVSNVEHVEMDQSGVQLYTADGKPRNLPIPSSDPNDPLNMSPHRQRVLIAAICVFAITGFGVVQTTPLFFGNLVQEYMVQSRGVRCTQAWS